MEHVIQVNTLLFKISRELLNEMGRQLFNLCLGLWVVAACVFVLICLLFYIVGLIGRPVVPA